MYHALVRRLARRTFRRLSAGDLDRFMSVFGPDSVFCFAGDHALGGEMRGQVAIRSLMERMLHLMPGIRVEPREMLVQGWPWATVMANRLRVSARLPDGTLYRNEGMQYLRLRWGKVVEDRVYEDTQALVGALDHLRALGVGEPPVAPVA